jgi:S-DNA-T family DNA segregation ATPase FtsK/SpoIIIE
VSAMADAWTGPAVPALRVLPQRVTTDELAAIAAESATGGPWANDGQGLTDTEVPIGLRETDLRPVGLDLTAGTPHFLVFGDAESGKTSFLRAWMRGLAARYSPWQVRLILIDYRRSLLEALPEPYIGAHAGDPDLAATFIEQVVDKLKERVPPPGIGSQQLRERDWWDGPELYVVADDYDVVAGGPDRGPLAPLAPYVTQAADLGLHVVVARRVGGAARTLMGDPLVGRLREFGADGLILSGDPREGALLGEQRAARRNPGRGVLVRRRQDATVVQIALDEEKHPVEYAGRPAEPVETVRS